MSQDDESISPDRHRVFQHYPCFHTPQGQKNTHGIPARLERHLRLFRHFFCLRNGMYFGTGHFFIKSHRKILKRKHNTGRKDSDWNVSFSFPQKQARVRSGIRWWEYAFIQYYKSSHSLTLPKTSGETKKRPWKYDKLSKTYRKHNP